MKSSIRFFISSLLSNGSIIRLIKSQKGLINIYKEFLIICSRYSNQQFLFSRDRYDNVLTSNYALSLLKLRIMIILFDTFIFDREVRYHKIPISIIGLRSLRSRVNNNAKISVNCHVTEIAGHCKGLRSRGGQG